MKKSGLSSNVKELLAAPETDAEFIRKFTSDLQQQMERYSRAANLSAVGMGLLSLLFLLFVAHGVGEFALFGVKITRYSALVIALPPVIALLLIRLAMQAQYGGIIADVYHEFTNQAFPAFAKAGFTDLVVQDDVPFIPTPTSIWRGSRLWKLSDRLATLMVVIIALAPIAFFVYAFYILFNQYHPRKCFCLALSSRNCLVLDASNENGFR